MPGVVVKMEPRSPPQESSEVESQGNNRKHSRAFEFLLQIAESLPTTVLQQEEEEEEVGEKAEITSSIEMNSSAGGRIPKRQRCNHAAHRSKGIALDKWRQIAKRNPQLSPTRGIARRYKLLADVLC